MPKLFLTSYAEGDGYYGGYIEADNIVHARQLAVQRGLNERIEGEIRKPALPSDLMPAIRRSDWVGAAHTATYLGFLGLMSGALSPREVLGDAGLVHELLHLARPLTHHPDEAPAIVKADKAERRALVRRVKAMAAAYEYRVPGWQPSDGKPGVIVGTAV